MITCPVCGRLCEPPEKVPIWHHILNSHAQFYNYFPKMYEECNPGQLGAFLDKFSSKDIQRIVDETYATFLINSFSVK